MLEEFKGNNGFLFFKFPLGLKLVLGYIAEGCISTKRYLKKKPVSQASYIGPVLQCNADVMYDCNFLFRAL